MKKSQSCVTPRQLKVSEQPSIGDDKQCRDQNSSYLEGDVVETGFFYSRKERRFQVHRRRVQRSRKAFPGLQAQCSHRRKAGESVTAQLVKEKIYSGHLTAYVQEEQRSIRRRRWVMTKSSGFQAGENTLSEILK